MSIGWAVALFKVLHPSYLWCVCFVGVGWFVSCLFGGLCGSFCVCFVAVCVCFFATVLAVGPRPE